MPICMHIWCVCACICTRPHRYAMSQMSRKLTWTCSRTCRLPRRQYWHLPLEKSSSLHLPGPCHLRTRSLDAGRIPSAPAALFHRHLRLCSAPGRHSPRATLSLLLNPAGFVITGPALSGLGSIWKFAVLLLGGAVCSVDTPVPHRVASRGALFDLRSDMAKIS